MSSGKTFADVSKLRSAASSTYTTTTTTYGPNNSTWWGEAQTVVEDAGGLNRTTTTNVYDAIGRATDVTRPTGRFVTSYDLDGLIQSVTTSGNPVVTYNYGTTNGQTDNGQPDKIVDGLTGVTQRFTYDSNPSDGGCGQVQSVSQSATTAGTGAYSVAYNYTSHGERSFVTYATPNDTTIWQYADYKQVGQGTDGKMAFQTLLKVTGSVASPVPTSEEEDYAYDTSGRVESAAFAQTPASGFTPGSGQRWYSASEEPASRCREFFDFDPAGRNLNLQYMWETFNPTSTSPTSVNNVTGWNYTYENSGQARGLKLTSSLYNGSGTAWNPMWDAFALRFELLLSTKRTFDAWGNVRRGAQNGDPAARYCGSIGHTQDDESGLVYMRARYDDPSLGRFVSQDAGRNGSNWYSYASNRPTDRIDHDGTDDDAESDALCFVGNWLVMLGKIFIDPTYVCLSDVVSQFAKSLSNLKVEKTFGKKLGSYLNSIIKLDVMMTASVCAASDVGDCNNALSTVAGYEMACEGVMLMTDGGDGRGDWGFTVGTPT